MAATSLASRTVTGYVLAALIPQAVSGGPRCERAGKRAPHEAGGGCKGLGAGGGDSFSGDGADSLTGAREDGEDEGNNRRAGVGSSLDTACCGPYSLWSADAVWVVAVLQQRV